jgi:hypothetical protein
MNADYDLCGPMKTFALLAERIVPDSMISFDQCFNDPHWARHEYSAFRKSFNDLVIGFRHLGSARRRVAIHFDATGPKQR